MTVSIMKVYKDKDGIEHYELIKNIGSLSVNGQRIEFKVHGHNHK